MMSIAGVCNWRLSRNLWEDVSGSIQFVERPGGCALIAHLQDGDPRNVFTSKQDRLSPHTLDTIATACKIWEMGITAHFTAEGGASLGSPLRPMSNQTATFYKTDLEEEVIEFDVFVFGSWRELQLHDWSLSVSNPANANSPLSQIVRSLADLLLYYSFGIFYVPKDNQHCSVI